MILVEPEEEGSVRKEPSIEGIHHLRGVWTGSSVDHNCILKTDPYSCSILMISESSFVSQKNTPTFRLLLQASG